MWDFRSAGNGGEVGIGIVIVITVIVIAEVGEEVGFGGRRVQSW